MAKINLKRFKNALENTRGIKSLIAKRLGVTRLTVYNYLEKNPKAREMYEEEAEKTQDLAESTLNRKIQEGDMSAVKIALLNHKRGRERGYGEKTEIEHSTGKEGFRIDAEEISKIWEESQDEKNKK
ncbi:MAG: helix-turn-helix domain-containing protein [Atribacterota bacterium]